MLTIEGVLGASDSSDALFSPNYFKSTDEFLQFIRDGRWYLLGWAVVNHSPTVITLDTSKMHNLNELGWYQEPGRFILGKYDQEWVVDNPPIPPQFGWISPTESIDMSILRTRYLRVHDSTAPRYFYLDAAWGDVKVVKEEGSDDLLIHQPVHSFEAKNSIYFVNGLCCRPTVSGKAPYGETVTLEKGSKYYDSNKDDRDRGIVVVDFGASCVLSFIDVVTTAGSIDTDVGLDQSSSYLLVVDGRLLTPSQFRLDPDGHIRFEKSAYKDAWGLDRLCCEGDFIGRTTTRTLKSTRNLKFTPKADLADYDNTFIIKISRPGLRVVIHEPFACDPTDHGTQVRFNGLSHGIMMDMSTMSVHSFLRATFDNDFYCVESTTPLKWLELIAMMPLETPMELWAKHNDNMSVHASMHDRRPVKGTGMLLKPKYALLDFYFQG